ncbi:SMI1/KNR4 family protein [Microbacterium sp. KRD172]|uniref:SMI1/KNR4 family protein n=1 Tax=Microbacterium sp. KRD172 TaxID=2729727 RepID=UPI0019D080A9|nr:SMI1/KNR4 family protein [Microbacterium sp. KRD172]
MIVIEDWRPPIVEMVMTKQNLAAWDPKGLFPNHLPEVAATEESIREAELALGVTFDKEHRGFLGFADGWKCFHQEVTLLGSRELVAGELREAALESFEYAPEMLEELGRSAEELLPIAASLEQADVFVMLIEEGAVGPRVLWLAEGELIDTFDSFGQFFVSMIEYTKRRIDKMQEEARAAGITDL